MSVLILVGCCKIQELLKRLGNHLGCKHVLDRLGESVSQTGSISVNREFVAYAKNAASYITRAEDSNA